MGEQTMTDDLRARLASAVTDVEAATVFLDLMYRLPVMSELRGEIGRLLDGPPAGWLGVGRLMMKDGAGVSLHDSGDGTTSDNGARARVYTFGPGIQRSGWAWARRLDCAFVLAAMGPEAAG